MTGITRICGLGSLVFAALALPGPAAAGGLPGVDVGLVLAVDVSESVDAGRYQLQLDGIASAFEAPELARQIAGGPNGAVAVTLMEFSDPDRQFAVIPWTRLSQPAELQALAEKIRHLHRSSNGLTGLGDALLAADGLFASLPYAATRRVVDVSGDGMANIGTGITIARDRLVADGITINGLPILGDEPAISVYYSLYVIGGPSAFALPAQSLDSFGVAMKRKLLQELNIS